MKTAIIFLCTFSLLLAASPADPYAGLSDHDRDIFLSSCLTIPPGQGRGLWTSNMNLKWPRHSSVKVAFLDGNSVWQEKVLNMAAEWTPLTDIKFERVESEADVRVTFIGQGYHSLVGKEAKVRRDPKPTMTLGFPAGVSDTEMRRVVLHEFGHVLGFSHEQQSPSVRIKWKEKEVLKFYASKQPPWDEATVRHNVLDRTDAANLPNSAATPFDPDSIMMYPVPAALTEDGFSVGWNTKLSQRDKAFARQQYLE